MVPCHIAWLVGSLEIWIQTLHLLNNGGNAINQKALIQGQKSFFIPRGQDTSDSVLVSASKVYGLLLGNVKREVQVRNLLNLEMRVLQWKVDWEHKPQNQIIHIDMKDGKFCYNFPPHFTRLSNDCWYTRHWEIKLTLSGF